MIRSSFLVVAALALLGCGTVAQPEPGCTGSACVLPDGGMAPNLDAGNIGQQGDCRVLGCPSRTSHCKNPWTIANSTSTGTCDTKTGLCGFDFVEKACEQPTGGTCSGSQLTWYESPGHCVETGPEAHCEYAARTSPCANGCSGGKCSGLNCATTAHVCGNACVTNADVSHCGKVNCGGCNAPANATADCTSAACNFTCNAGFAWCGAQCQSCPVGTAAGGESCGGTTCVARWCDTTAGYFNGNGRCYRAEPVLNVTTTNAAYPQLAVGPTGNVHVLYTDVPATGAQFKLGYKKWDGAGWQSLVTTIPVIQVLAVAVDAQDRPAVALRPSSSSDKTQIAAWNGSTFAVSDVPGASYGLVAAGAPDGALHLAWITFTPGYQLHHAVFRGGQLTTEVVGPADAMSDVGVQVDAQGRVRLSFIDATTHAFTVLSQSGASWTTRTIEGAAGLYQPVLRLGPTGDPYLLGSSGGEVLLVAPSGGGFSTRFLPSGAGAPAWLIDGQGHFVGVAGNSSGMSLITDANSETSQTLSTSAVVGSAPAEQLALAADPRGGYFVTYRAYNGLLRLFHFQ